MDKAGAYAIQGGAASFVQSIKAPIPMSLLPLCEVSEVHLATNRARNYPLYYPKSMDLTGQLAKLFKPAKRPHPLEAELSIREVSVPPKKISTDRTKHPCQRACPAGTDIPAT